MDYLIVPWHLFLANKWIFLNEIALPNSLNCNDTLLISELMEKPLEVLIAKLIPFRNREVLLGLQQILHGLNDTFVTLTKSHSWIQIQIDHSIFKGGIDKFGRFSRMWRNTNVDRRR